MRLKIASGNLQTGAIARPLACTSQPMPDVATLRTEPELPAAVPTEVVFRARGLTKVYRMGEVAVHALRAVDGGTIMVSRVA